MSACISRQGEFGTHEPDDEFTCARCGVLDEEAMRDELSRLRTAPALVPVSDPEIMAGLATHLVEHGLAEEKPGYGHATGDQVSAAVLAYLTDHP